MCGLDCRFIKPRRIHLGCDRLARTVTCHQIPKNVPAFTEFERQVLSNAMARLSVEHRDVIRRAYYRGLSTEQIAADLKLSECEVKCRLHYGLRRLLSCWRTGPQREAR